MIPTIDTLVAGLERAQVMMPTAAQRRRVICTAALRVFPAWTFNAILLHHGCEVPLPFFLERPPGTDESARIQHIHVL